MSKKNEIRQSEVIKNGDSGSLDLYREQIQLITRGWMLMGGGEDGALGMGEHSQG